MAYIRVDLQMTAFNGQAVTFKSPVDCSVIDGLRVYYPGADGTETSSTFALADAHGNNVGGANLFAANVIVKVILDTEAGMAFVQNADTNAYLEGKFTQVSNAAAAAQTAASDAATAAANAQTTADGKMSYNANLVQFASDVLTTLGGAAVDVGGVKIATGSYVGTGKSGQNNPNSLTFDFAPKLLAIPYVDSGSAYTLFYTSDKTFIMFSDMLTTEYQVSEVFLLAGNYASYGKKSADGKTFYWYNSNIASATAAEAQANKSGYEYFYFAIG